MTETLNLDDIQNITDVMEAQWTGLQGEGLGPVTYHLNQSYRSFSVQAAGGNDVWDYYFLEMQGFGRVELQPGGAMSDWTVEALAIYLGQATAPGTPSIDLVDTEPPTANSVGSYTTSISGTLSGSVGAFGKDRTVSISASVTYSSSHTTEVSALTIVNQSSLTYAGWLFKVDPGTSMAQGQVPINVIALARVPHGTGDLAFEVGFRIYMRNTTDGVQAAYDLLKEGGFDPPFLPTVAVPSFIPAFVIQSGSPTQLAGLDNSDGHLCAFDFSKTFTVKAPPPPASSGVSGG